MLGPRNVPLSHFLDISHCYFLIFFSLFPSFKMHITDIASLSISSELVSASYSSQGKQVVYFQNLISARFHDSFRTLFAL